MTRKYIDCREYPDSNCTLKISGTEQEVLLAAVDHATKQHGREDTQEFRDSLRKSLKSETQEQAKVA